MLRSALTALVRALPAAVAEAHCDGPCGVYDPASARVAAEAVLSMTKKLKAMEAPLPRCRSSSGHNSPCRCTSRKEAQKTKKELLILWTDHFKLRAPGHIPRPARHL